MNIIVPVFRQLNQFWDAAGEFWQLKWDLILDFLGEDPYIYWVYGTVFVTFILYWSFGAAYTIFDVTNKSSAFKRYKVQPGTNEPIDKNRLIKVIVTVLFNQIFIGIPFTWAAYGLLKWRGLTPIRTLPTFHWGIGEIGFFIIIEEIGFYYSHRILHNRFIYKHFHKQHHEWTAPIALTAIYCHPMEYIFSDLLPPFIGVFIAGSHVATAYVWFSLAILNTLNSHCGYHFPLLPSPESHDFHHLKFNQCYGILGILDWLHGTDLIFKSSKNYKRDITLFTFTPARNLFPDTDKGN